MAANAPEYMWPYALLNFVQVRNLLPTSGGVSPDESWHSYREPLEKRLAAARVWGSMVYLHVPPEQRNKLGSKARPAVYLGFSHRAKAYVGLDLDTGNIRMATAASFHESFKPWSHPGVVRGVSVVSGEAMEVPSTVFSTGDYFGVYVTSTPAVRLPEPGRSELVVDDASFGLDSGARPVSSADAWWGGPLPPLEDIPLRSDPGPDSDSRDPRDPREDLSGNDVGRKLLILARELDLANEF